MAAASTICRQSIRKLKHFGLKCFANRHTSTSTSGGYFVFIPEVPVDTKESNPIMKYDEYPKFSQLNQKNIVSGCAKMALEFDSKFDTLVENLSSGEWKKLSFEEIINYIEEILAPMNYAEHTVNILMLNNFVKYPKALLDRVSSQMSRSQNDRFVNEEFIKQIKSYNKDRSKLTEFQQRLLDYYLLEISLNGTELQGKNRKVYFDTIRLISVKEAEFWNKALTQKRMYTLLLNKDMWDIVKELPPAVRGEISADRNSPDKGPWKVNLLPWVYESFVENCPRRDLRFQLWQAYNTIGTHPSADVRTYTVELVDDIRVYRGDIANVLGYKNYTEMSMATKMAGTTETVLKMLDTYRTFFLPKAKQEIADLQMFAKTRGMHGDLKPWDIPYYRKQHAQQLYKVNKINKHPYFSYNKVISTLFNLCEVMLEIQFKECIGVDKWDEHVLVYDAHNKDGSFVARLYIDPFNRPKSKVSRMYSELGRERCNKLGMTPISYISMTLHNFSDPAIPTLMSYQQVLDLFYQFGYSLQHMLTAVPYSELSSLRLIEWDAVHACSYVMKMFAKQPETIKAMSEHYQTRQQLSDSDIKNLLQCQQHLAAFDMCHELYASAFDLECHLKTEYTWREVQKQVYKLFMPIELNKDDWIWASDPQLWMGRTYAAGYYQHIWSKMLAANIFEVFQTEGLNKEASLNKVGMRFRETYLSIGGGVHAMEVFRRFKGHNPSFECLFKMY